MRVTPRVQVLRPLMVLLVLFKSDILALNSDEVPSVDPPNQCCPSGNDECCDPCVLDPEEECPGDPLRGIPTDDDSLIILNNLEWPRRDVQWFLEAFKKANNDFKNIEVSKQTTIPTLISRDPQSRASRLAAEIDISVSCGSVTEDQIVEVAEFANAFHLDLVVEAMSIDTTRQENLAVLSGARILATTNQIELEIRNTNITFGNNKATLQHQLAFRKSDTISTNMAKVGTVVNVASKEFTRLLAFPNVTTVGLEFLGELSQCKREFQSLLRPNLVGPCDPDDPYRTIDGSCNNVDNELWGASFIPYRRELPAAYDDGTRLFRKSVFQFDLPSARLVSSVINNAKSAESPSFTILHMTYGQFIDHDLVATPLARASFQGYSFSESPVRCCNTPIVHPECAPIEIPFDDPFYSCFGQTCMEFVRSAPADGNCMMGQRQQTNQHTAYLDGSVIYGVKPSEINDLRSFVDGLLKFQLSKDDQELLPKDTSDNEDCNTEEHIALGEFCFKAGDGRVNEQILLTFFQTLWAREHNRVARVLKHSNQDWGDERLFQEARRIVGAQLQQVTYAEFLPTVIGPTLMTTSKLYPLEGDGRTTDYDEHINAGIGNSFGAAAYRFGHSLVADNLLYVSKEGKVSTNELSTLYFNPFELYRRDGVCDVARGGISRPGNQMDALFTPEVSGKLFRGERPFGLDLVALNIQRGRDHGLPPYNEWRVLCGLPRVTSFQDLSDQMTQERIEAIESVYDHVDDIDLYVGGVSENPLPGAILGHTFTCLVHNQFYRMKYGDRYWFEYKNGPGAFTGAQLKQLHRVTLARIMCDNVPELEYIQRWPLRNPGPDNPRVCCKSIRQYNLDPWNPDFVDDNNEEPSPCQDEDGDGEGDC